jgi:peptidoglycan/LPS O-acetylase OafA/YrhL
VVNYPGDIPPSPEERAELRLAANAAWLKRVKEGHQDDASHIAWAEKRMQEDNAKAVAAAKKAIEAERKAHKCYICGRTDPPRWARLFGLAAAALLVVYFYATERFPHDAALFGLAGVAAIGAALASAAHEAGKPEDEAEIRRRFNEKPLD